MPSHSPSVMEWPDCANLERDIRSGRHFCCRHGHTYAHVWRIVWHLLDEQGAVHNDRLDQSVVKVTWTRAHTSEQAADRAKIPRLHWILNRWADKGAKWAAFEQIPPPAGLDSDQDLVSSSRACPEVDWDSHR